MNGSRIRGTSTTRGKVRASIATLSSNRLGHLCGIIVSDKLSGKDHRDTHLLVSRNKSRNKHFPIRAQLETSFKLGGHSHMWISSCVSQSFQSEYRGTCQEFFTVLADMCLLHTMDKFMHLHVASPSEGLPQDIQQSVCFSRRISSLCCKLQDGGYI